MIYDVKKELYVRRHGHYIITVKTIYFVRIKKYLSNTDQSCLEPVLERYQRSSSAGNQNLRIHLEAP